MAFGSSSKQAFLDAVKPPAPARGDDDLARLEKLAELLSAPAAVKQRLADLKVATDTANAAIAKAEEERKAAAKLVAQTHLELAAERKGHDEKLAAEVAAHEAAMKAGKDDLAAKAKALADDRKAFEAERAALKAKADSLRQHLEVA